MCRLETRPRWRGSMAVPTSGAGRTSRPEGGESSSVHLGRLFADRDGDLEPVLRGRERAAVRFVVGAERVVGPVEVHLVAPVGQLVEVEVAACAVGLLPRR